MSDPIPLLVDYVAGKLKATRDEEKKNILFGEDGKKGSFPLSKKSKMVSNKGTGDRIELDALWFLIEYANLPYAEYLRKTKASTRVAFNDRNELIGYFRGTLESIPQLPLIQLDAMDIDDDEEEQVVETGENKSDIASLLDKPLDLSPDEEEAKKAHIERIRAGNWENISSDDPFYVKDKTVMDEIRKKEKPFRTLDSVMSADTRFTDCMKIVERFVLQRGAEQRKRDKKRIHDANEKLKLQGNTRYNFNADRVWTDNVGNLEDLGINADASNIVNEDIDIMNEPVNRKRARPSSSTSSSRPSKQAKSTRKVYRSPIIIIPRKKSLINFENAQEFLVNSKFMKGKSALGKDFIEINDPETNRRFKIVPDHRKLHESDWKRIVAIVALGEAWQFKGMKETDPAKLFSEIKGYFFHFEDEKPSQTVNSWNVEKIKISKSGRHKDKASSVQFWKSLRNEINHQPERWGK